MAQVHNQLSRGQLSRALTLAVGDRRGVGGLERYGETLQPIIDLWALPEFAAYRDEQLAAVRTFQAAVAAEFSAIALVNPAGSNLIAVLEGVTVSSSGGATAFLEIALDSAMSGTLLVTAFPAASRDRRFKGATGTTRCFIRQGTDPALNTYGAQLEQIVSGASQLPFQIALPAILRPGDGAVVVLQNVNLTLTVCWAWRERQAYPGELG